MATESYDKVVGLQYCLVYKKGVENRPADALLRKAGGHKDDLMAMSTCVLSWLTEVAERYK